MRHPRSSRFTPPSRIPNVSGIAQLMHGASLVIAALVVSANSPLLAQGAADSAHAYRLTHPTELKIAPTSGSLGQLRAGATVEVLARQRGWVRVQVEGWIPDSVLTPADTAFQAQLSAADIRANPAAMHGKMVQWPVQFLALQAADPLRHGLADEEPYLLARGPGAENALLYLAVPPSLLGTARALQPLAKLIITARVREGRSEPVGIPILDILTLRITK